jgi:hypothetical protein
MKRLITLLVAVAIGITIFAAPMVADPGATTDTSITTSSTDSTWTNPDYPPPPDGYVGPWPPSDSTMTTTTDGDDGDEDPWNDPNQ